MKIIIVGLNHKTAPVDVRERLAFSEERSTQALYALKEHFAVGEFVILSTCNRVELYSAVPADGGPSPEELAAFLAQFTEVRLEEFQNHLYRYQDEEAVRHLLAVACSLDSIVVGEPQIIGQVKDSYRLATAAKSAGKVISRLFHCAFTTSKEVYSSTSIAQRRISVAGVAVELARQLFADLQTARVLVIGAGEMGELLIRHLQDVDCKQITVITRTYERGQGIAQRYNTSVQRWEELNEQLIQADIVVTAATTDQYLFDKPAFQQVLKQRRRGALLAIDIAVPRNFDPAINDLDDVYLYSVDDLGAVVQENLDARQEDIAAANEIVEDNVASFMDWFGVKDIGPLVGMLRETFQQISLAELTKFFAADRDMSAMTKRQLETMVNRTVNKLLHRLINSLHDIAKQQSSDDAVRFIQSILDQKDRSSPS
jgi:glutamyl-tRNA reductase